MFTQSVESISVHSFIFLHSPVVVEANPNISLLSDTLQVLLEDPDMFPGQRGDIITVSFGFDPGSHLLMINPSWQLVKARM